METLALNGVEFLTWWLIEQSAEDKEQYGELCRIPIDHADDAVVCLHTKHYWNKSCSVYVRTPTLVVFAGQGSTGVRACNADSVEESGAAGTLSTI